VLNVGDATIPNPLPDALVELIAQRLRVIGEPMRIRLLDALRDGPRTVNELSAALGTTQQNVSKHLGVLASAGLITREKDGTRVHCAIADPSVFELCSIVCDGLRRQAGELERALGGAPGAGAG
jgi:DNA-binding transcriptional ArsR family regulator